MYHSIVTKYLIFFLSDGSKVYLVNVTSNVVVYMLARLRYKHFSVTNILRFWIRGHLVRWSIRITIRKGHYVMTTIFTAPMTSTWLKRLANSNALWWAFWCPTCISLSEYKTYSAGKCHCLVRGGYQSIMVLGLLDFEHWSYLTEVDRWMVVVLVLVPAAQNFGRHADPKPPPPPSSFKWLQLFSELSSIRLSSSWRRCGCYKASTRIDFLQFIHSPTRNMAIGQNKMYACVVDLGSYCTRLMYIDI